MSTATAAEVKVGDFFYSSWGYDQTNIDFYKVVGLTPSGKSVKVQKWTSAVESSAVGADYVVAGGGPVMERDLKPGVSEEDYWAMDYWERQEATVEVPAKVETKRLQSYGEGESKRFYFSVNSYSSASLWDGQPQYETASGWGH